MNRLLVLLLAAFDAVLTAAVGVALALAPLTLLWVFAFGADAAWPALWPAAVRVWQLGDFVPLEIALPEEFALAAGIPAEGASFALSLAPAAFALFATVSGARSGRRAARSGAWAVGVLAGAVVTAAAAALLHLTAAGADPVATADPFAAIALPTAVFALPALVAALATAWRLGDDGLVDRVRAALPPRFAAVPAAAARGAAAAVAGVVGVGALLLVVALIARGGETIALYDSAGLDLTGVVVVALGQLAYLPVLVVWAVSFAAGPGFALGTGTSVTPAGTSLGVVPGIPVLGVVPPSTSPWLLVLALLVVGAGVLGGLVARRALAREADAEGLGPRAAALGGMVLVVGVAALALGAAASGSLGPGALAETGPSPWWLALAVALETGGGAAAVLLAPRTDETADGRGRDAGAAPAGSGARARPVVPADPDTQPTEELPRPSVD